MMDLALAGPVFVLTLPVQGAIAAAVARSMGRPVIFHQERPGLNGEIFTLHKFRTMVDVDPERGKVHDDDRITPLGHFLRSTSLDELPTLWNVIRGDMSLVGPRPLLVRYLDRYTAQQARRHEVRPGLTGLAQISGRNALSWEKKFELDVWYVDNHTLLGDLKIIAGTVRAVLKRDGISAEGITTMHEFMGAAADEPDQSATPPDESTTRSGATTAAVAT
ncbi:sugar transferase [Rudaeicoccus suwonensis]|uniref:Lipopolysaccharide/colanic/teichoic acid biosynthesis glycosyltransferase n=1 Tax=Rudaeicoccus suwonensis TaxID=657409 RepID=A0A561E8T4_9MICO|nr:sugar transferase [Rudaeicoccus suwonensis]TWE12019.1 lipopolysaccharide/colanic/teichoic acid biosynthesis glycosyltransferase [Rudaeicoccus suwonensis]